MGKEMYLMGDGSRQGKGGGLVKEMVKLGEKGE